MKLKWYTPKQKTNTIDLCCTTLQEYCRVKNDGTHIGSHECMAECEYCRGQAFDFAIPPENWPEWQGKVTEKISIKCSKINEATNQAL